MTDTPDRIAALLESAPVQAVDFVLDHVTVSPARFRAVAAALRAGRIGVVFDADQLATLGAIAAYDPNRNRFMLPGPALLNDPVQAGYVVHEAVHAATDRAARRTSLPLEEAGAFIAQIWFLQEQDVAPRDGMSASGVTFWRIATQIRARAAMEETPIRATREEVAQAWQAAFDAGYPARQFEADGI